MFRAFVLLALTSLLAACGGGGGGGGGFTSSDTISVRLSAARTTLPVNPALVGPRRDGFYTTELTADIKRADGSPVANGTVFQFAIDTGSASGWLYTLLSEDFDDETGHAAFISKDQESAGGKATMYLHARNEVGTVTVTVSAQDIATNENVSASVTISVGGVAGSDTPGQTLLISDGSVLFVQGLNGTTNQILQAWVLDEVSNAIGDPAAGVNNIRAEIIAGPGGGELLVGTSATGEDQQRGEISLATVNGVATFSLRSGGLPGTVGIQITADRSDNNVDNGIATPIRNVAATSIVTAFSDQPIDIVTTELPDGTVSVYYAAVAEATGGVPPYMFSITNGNLAPGLTLDPSGVIFGTPTQSGDFTFILNVIGQETGKIDSQVVTLTVAPPAPLTVSPDSLEDSTVGAGYSAVLEASGGSFPYSWSVSSGSLPPGLSFNSSTGTISGTTSTAGVFSFIVKLTDANGVTVFKDYSIAVVDDAEPVPNGTLTLSGSGDSTFDFNLLADGATTFTFTNNGSGPFEVDLLNSSGTKIADLFAGTGQFSGSTIETLTAGIYTLRITSDGTWSGTVFGPLEDGVVGGGGGTSSPTPTPVAIASIELLSSSPQLASDGTDNVTLTAVVRDVNNVVVEGATVTFSANNNGSLQVTRSVTDETGTAEALLSIAGSQANRVITVTSISNGLSDSTTVAVVGTGIAIAGPTSSGLGDTVTLTFTLQDSSGEGIAGEIIEIASENGNTLSNSVPVTGISGQVTVDITADVSGTDTITASSNGAVATFTLIVAADEFLFIVPAEGTEIVISTDRTIRVQWLVDGTAAVGQTVTFTTTRGSFTDPVPVGSAITDASGIATVTITSSSAGPAVLTATGTRPDGTAAVTVTTQREVLFIATVPAILNLQAEPATIGVNPVGSSGEQSTLTAVVRDVNGNPVKGANVNFLIDVDITGGTIFPAASETDLTGRATTVYTAGSTSSAQNGVKLSAVVDGTAISDTVSITVAQQELFITLGTGNTILEPNETQYSFPYNVLITDSNGGPVANTNVILSIWPESYNKGRYQYFDPPGVWAPVYSVFGCVNEDLNRDGVFDDAGSLAPDFDENGNGRLDPGTVVTVSSTTVTTNSEGFAFFNVNYAQQYASWTNVELKAQTGVSGSESTEFQFFTLPAAASDLGDEKVAPPGQPSPFGVQATCAIQG